MELLVTRPGFTLFACSSTSRLCWYPARGSRTNLEKECGSCIHQINYNTASIWLAPICYWHHCLISNTDLHLWRVTCLTPFNSRNLNFLNFEIMYSVYYVVRISKVYTHYVLPVQVLYCLYIVCIHIKTWDSHSLYTLQLPPKVRGKTFHKDGWVPSVDGMEVKY